MGVREDAKRALEVQRETEEAERHHWLTVEMDDCVLHILIRKGTESVTEAQHRGTPLGGQYSAVLHPPHNHPIGQRHVHVYARNNQLFAINWDGSTHDHGSSGTRIPKRLAAALRGEFDGLVVPGVLESCALPPWARHLIAESRPASAFKRGLEQVLRDKT